MQPRGEVQFLGLAPRRSEADQPTRRLGRSHISSTDRRHVVPGKSGGWDVKKPSGQRSSAHTDTQAQAVARAEEIVGRAGGGEVRIHGRDGAIRNSDTVAPGNDPNPPRDKR